MNTNKTTNMRHELWRDFFQESGDANIKLYFGYDLEGEFFYSLEIEELYQHFKNRLIEELTGSLQENAGEDHK